MPSLKSILKKTFVYDWVRASRAKRQLAEWTDLDRRMLAFYRQFLAPGELCFDVGANLGNRVKIFRKLGARVVAVEPQLECAKVLTSVFGGDAEFTLVEKALGAAEGSAEMVISDATTVSSLSKEWLEAVAKSGRFDERLWDRTRTVPVTTLDRLIEQFGVPAFAKIDVEGFEYQVIQGLTRPVRALSLEFTPEVADSTFHCIDHLARLGPIEVNYSLEESMQMTLDAWVGRDEIVERLSAYRGDYRIYGDVYVRFAGP